jgi:hypothetical protein
MKTILLIASIALAGCASAHAVGQDLPAEKPCEYAESLAPFCLDFANPEDPLTCYGADAAVHENGSIVCVWRCVRFEGFYQDVYAVFNPEPALHLDTMIATGPAAQCD